MNTSDCLCRLVAYNSSLLLAHWNADTVTNEHKALGDLYDSMIELTDELAEVYMGKGNTVSVCDCSITELANPPEDGLKLVEELRGEFKVGKDDDLLNILADMSSSLNKAAYLLKSGEVSEDDEEFSDEDMPD